MPSPAFLSLKCGLEKQMFIKNFHVHIFTPEDVFQNTVYPSRAVKFLIILSKILQDFFLVNETGHIAIQCSTA